MHAPQGDLGGADQAEVGVLDRVDLRLHAAGRESDALQDGITCQVGCDDGCKSGADQFPDRELLEGQVQEHRVVLEEVEARAGHLAAGLEVDQVEGLAELDVVLDREVEGARGADLAELAAVVLGQADRGVGVGQVGDPPEPLADLVVHHPELLFLVAPPSPLSRLPSSISSARRAGSFSLPVAWAISFCRRRTSSTRRGAALPLPFEGDDPVDVLEHVGRHIPVAAVLLDRLGVGDDVFEIEHESSFEISVRDRDPEMRGSDLEATSTSRPTITAGIRI